MNREDALAAGFVPVTPAKEGYRQVGILINDIEFIPLDIMRRHMPFAQPPGMKIEAVYVRCGGEGSGDKSTDEPRKRSDVRP